MLELNPFYAREKLDGCNNMLTIHDEHMIYMSDENGVAFQAINFFFHCIK